MEMLQKAVHPHIVQIIELFEDRLHYYIVTEYFEGYDLIDKANQQIRLGAHLSEHQICHIMKQVLEAINYCHKTRICHRDIKAENILINDSDEIKIIDLGFADIVSTNEKNLSGYKGTEYCMAPEILKRKAYNEKCDIWSIGVVFYVLLAISQPFTNIEDQLKGKYKPIELVKRSDLAFDLLDKMLNPNSDERISALQALEHGWFQHNECKTHQITIDESQKKFMLENLTLMRETNKIIRIVFAYMSS